MKSLDRIKKAFFEYIYDQEVSLGDRLFIVFSLLIIAELIFIATPMGLVMHEPAAFIVSSLAGSLLYGGCIFYAFKMDKLDFAKKLLSFILVFLFLPLVFFANGGVQGGAPVALLLGGVYISLILDGRARIVMTVWYSIMMSVCWVAGYVHPELIAEFSQESSYFYSLAGLLIINAMVFVLLSFQSQSYLRESESAKNKAKELEELNRSQNRFFSSMSHEIRTPINSILGLNELILREQSASDEILRDASGIAGAGKMLLALINDILDFSKIEAGSMDIVPVDYNVGEMLPEVVNMIWLKALEKGLGFNVHIDPKVPSVLYGDEVRIKQIIINLLNNAVKYTQEGSVELQVESEAEDEKSTILTITISDTGMGIKKESLPHLFDAFKRVDEEKNRYIEGTGLGLSIVKQLIELMGGTVTVSSVYGEGSTFTVTLRQGISNPEEVGVLNIHNAGNARRVNYESSFTAPEARVLIVDDNEMNLEVEKKLLVATQLGVDTVLSGREALDAALRTHYDVILMDHLMPEMDGIECLEQLRNQIGGLNRTTAVIALTANAGSENRDMYNRAGFDGYLVKPVSGEALENILMRHIPEEKITLNLKNSQFSEDINTAEGYARKSPVIITSTSMSDLPDSVIKKLRIPILPFLIYTDEGVFKDGVQLDANEMIRYINEGKNAVTDTQGVEEYTDFFAGVLKKTHHVIHIALTAGMSKDFSIASEAAKAFDNVTVVNSECLSSATGILVLIACKLAQQNLSVEEIVEELNIVKHRLRCSFVLDTTDYMADRGLISKRINRFARVMNLHPSLMFKEDKAGIGGIYLGGTKRAYKKYIRKAFPVDIIPDSEVVFITYVDVPLETLEWIREEISKIAYFERVIFNQASAAISSNCGPGTFGILYFVKSNKNYNIASLLPDEEDEDEAVQEEGREDAESMPLLQYDLEQDAEADEGGKAASVLDRRIAGLDCIDLATALRNSGSEAAFLSVLKIFYDSIGAKSGELEGYYQTEDWANYTIKIHALKSSAKLVGALELSEEALALETAGKEGDTAYIAEHHASFMAEYLRYKEFLAGIYEEEKEDSDVLDDRPVADAYLMESVYEGLRGAAVDMDADAIEEILGELGDYALPDEDKKKIDALRGRAEEFDYDGIIEILGADFDERDA